MTAANSSSISDGAAALVMMRESEAEKRGAAPLARVVAHSTHAAEPSKFPTAPIGALKKLFDKTGWSKDSVDLYEINEAFAVVAMAAMRDLGLPHEKVNVNGGACALGHPIGASGARILVTLIAALRARGLKRGVASLCIGGGERKGAAALARETQSAAMRRRYRRQKKMKRDMSSGRKRQSLRRLVRRRQGKSATCFTNDPACF